MQQAAYDLSTFEKREKQQKPRLKVANGAKPKRKFDFSGLKVVATVAIIVSLAWGVLYSRAQVTELTTQISTTQTSLSNAKSEYDYLNLQLESKTDLSSVETYAVTQLGLTKMDASQVTYLTLEDEDKAVKPKSEVKTLLDQFSNGFLNAMEYLAP